ncbi:MAG: DUF4125 family protein, partial [Oscillospiraceae bacterium]|nr:DUF4125 family protein [Oscillospiraceae bacterium]
MFLIIYFYIIVAAIILLVLGIGIVLFISGTVLVIDGIKHKNKPISQPMKIGFGVTLLMIGVNLACFYANIIIDYKMEEFAKEFPKIAGTARSIHTEEDNEYNTSYETYLRGELGTYSEHTFI